MSNPSKRIGSVFASAVRDYLSAALGRKLVRPVDGAAKDEGDLFGIPNWAVEIKAERAIDLAGYMREAEVEAANAGADNFLAVVKARRRPVSEAYAVMPLRKWAEMYRSINGGPE